MRLVSALFLCPLAFCSGWFPYRLAKLWLWHLLFLFFFNPHMRTSLLILERGKGRERERERNSNVREKHRLVAFHICPDLGPDPQPRYVPWLKLNPRPFSLWDDAPTNWATLARVAFIISALYSTTAFPVFHTNQAVVFLNIYCFPNTIIFFWKAYSRSLTHFVFLCSAHSRWSKNTYQEMLSKLNIFSIPVGQSVDAHGGHQSLREHLSERLNVILLIKKKKI